MNIRLATRGPARALTALVACLTFTAAAMPALAGESEVVFDATVIISVQRTEVDGATVPAAGAIVFLHAYAGVDEERDRPVQSLEAVADGAGNAVLTGVARAAEGAPAVDLRVVGAATDTDVIEECTVTTDYQGSVTATSAPGIVEVRLSLGAVGSTEDCATQTQTPSPTPLPTPRPTTKVRPTPVPTSDPTPEPTTEPTPTSAPDPTAEPTASATADGGGDGGNGNGNTGNGNGGAGTGGTEGPSGGDSTTVGGDTTTGPAGSEHQGAAAPGRASAPELTPPATDTTPARHGSTSDPRLAFLLGIALLGMMSASVLVARRLRSHIA